MKGFLIIFAFFICSSFAPAKSALCTCGDDVTESLKDKTKVEFYYASLIFTGKVIKIEHLEEGYRRSYNSPIKYTFEIDELIKGGVGGNTVEIYSAWTDRNCGFIFEDDTSYLVFSKKTVKFKEFTKDTWSNTTSMCIGNTLRRRTEKRRLDIMRKLAKE